MHQRESAVVNPLTYAGIASETLGTGIERMWWRRRRDSNPRDGFPPTPLAGERLRPLGHISADGFTIICEERTRANCENRYI